MMLFSVYIVAGHFLFMNSSSQKPGDVVRIKTPFFPASHGVCYMRFWYYMFGATNIGPLKVWRERERERERERKREEEIPSTLKKPFGFMPFFIIITTMKY